MTFDYQAAQQPSFVTLAQAGTQNGGDVCFQRRLDSRFRGNDGKCQHCLAGSERGRRSSGGAGEDRRAAEHGAQTIHHRLITTLSRLPKLRPPAHLRLDYLTDRAQHMRHALLLSHTRQRLSVVAARPVSHHHPLIVTRHDLPDLLVAVTRAHLVHRGLCRGVRYCFDTRDGFTLGLQLDTRLPAERCLEACRKAFDELKKDRAFFEQELGSLVWDRDWHPEWGSQILSHYPSNFYDPMESSDDLHDWAVEQYPLFRKAFDQKTKEINRDSPVD